jgi:CheY-like chemotaxis protein
MDDVRPQPSDLERSLRSLSERAVDCHTARAEFAVGIGQALWGPLAHLSASASHLLAGELEPALRSEVELVAAAAESMHELLASNLTLEPRPETTGLQRALFDLQEALAPVLKAFAPRADRRGIAFACRIGGDVPPVLIGEPQTLCAIVRLLLDEALRGGGADEIALELRMAGPEAGERALELTLHGLQDDPARAPGLAACARLARQLDGRLWLELPHGGSGRVRLRLRCERVPDRRRRPREAGTLECVTIVGPPGIARDALVDNLTQHGVACESFAALRLVRMPRPGEGPRTALVAESAWDEDRAAQLDGFLETLRLGSIFLISARPGRVALEAERAAGVRGVLRAPALPRECLDVLARAARGPQPLDDSPAAPAPVERLSLLLAEADGAQRAVVRAVLERAGHLVAGVEDGLALMALLEERPFDALLVDLDLPVLDALSSARLLRARERRSGRRTPIIGLTLDPARVLDRDLGESGLDACLSLPLDPDRLSWTLARLCGVRDFESGAA